MDAKDKHDSSGRQDLRWVCRGSPFRAYKKIAAQIRSPRDHIIICAKADSATLLRDEGLLHVSCCRLDSAQSTREQVAIITYSPPHRSLPMPARSSDCAHGPLQARTCSCRCPE